jgi:hypothetical protein
MMYLWVLSTFAREDKLDVLHQMAKKQIIDLTFHHDALFSNHSVNSSVHAQVGHEKALTPEMRAEDKRVSDNAKLHWPNLTYEADNTTLALDSSVMTATGRLLASDVFDRTFLLLAVFCICWKHSSSNKAMKTIDEEDSGTIEDASIYNMAGIDAKVRITRLFVASTVGILAVDLACLLTQHNFFIY